MIRCSTCNVYHIRKFFVWVDTVEFNRMQCQNDKMCDDAIFADWFRYELAMFSIDRAISTPSCSYCILNRSCKNHCSILPNILLFCMIWYGWIQSSTMFNQQDIGWCFFHQSIPISIDYVWRMFIDMAISTTWYSNCTWNTYCQNLRSILPNLQLFGWFDTVAFNRLLCSNNNTYDDVVFFQRFRYQLAIFGVLIGLSLLLYTHIVYEIVIYKSPLVTGMIQETISHAGL